VTLGATELTLQCANRLGLLGAKLMMAGTEGIIGNQVFK
jgi:hypothetical protein